MSTQPCAVVFGTGRIACGVLGELLRDAGWDVTFIGRNADVVASLKAHRGYRLRLSSGTASVERRISGVGAVHADDRRAVRRAIVAADLAFTAVGATNLDGVADMLADAAPRRGRPLDVIACENHDDAGGLLQTLLDDRGVGHDHVGGVAGGLVTRAVSARLGDPNGPAPLTFVGEPVREVFVDAASLSAAIPEVDGFVPVTDFAAYVQRKLYVFSAGHATAAYLGRVKGYHFVHAAVRDPEIAAEVMAAMREGQVGVAARYGAAFAAFGGPPLSARRSPRCTTTVSRRGAVALDAIMHRFANATLCDPVARVGRDPRRKLQPHDRLLGAAALARTAGIEPEHLVMAAAAALCFDCDGDTGAAAIRDGLAVGGVAATLSGECGHAARDGLVDAVADAWQHLTGGQRGVGNALLSLRNPQWAWQG